MDKRVVDLRAMVGCLVEVFRERLLKVNVNKSKVIVLNGVEGLKCEVHIDGMHLEYVSTFKWLDCILDESGTNEAKCQTKVATGRRSCRCYLVHGE